MSPLAYFAVGFSALIFVIGILIIISPPIVYDRLDTYKETLWLYLSAVFLRGAVGVALILTSASTKHPQTVEALGWLAALAAGVLLLVGKRRFVRLMKQAISMSTGLGRLSGVFAVVFGSFIVYAYL